MVKKGERIGLDLDRVGREPLALEQPLLLHPAGCCSEGPLRDLKGTTAWFRGLIVAGDVVVA